MSKYTMFPQRNKRISNLWLKKKKKKKKEFHKKCHTSTDQDKRGHLYNIFLFLYENFHCGYSVEVPQQGASKETHNICFVETKKISLYQYLFVDQSALSDAMYKFTY